MAETYEYAPLTEEELYRAFGLGELWDGAEAGIRMYVLLRERLRAAEAAVLKKVGHEFERSLIDGPDPAATSRSTSL